MQLIYDRKYRTIWTSFMRTINVFFILLAKIDTVYSCAATQSSSNPTATTTTTAAVTTTTSTTTTTTTNPCAACGMITVINTPGVDQPITQTLGVDANGCATDTITCNNPNPANQVIFQFFNNGADMGTNMGTGTVTNTLVCNAQGQLTLTLNGATSVITSVECLAA